MSEMDPASINRGGEVSFPLWVKVVAWIMGLCFPVGAAGAIWIGAAIIDMKLTLAEMKPRLDSAVAGQYTQTQARDAHANLDLRIRAIEGDVKELESLHGRR